MKVGIPKEIKNNENRVGMTRLKQLAAELPESNRANDRVEKCTDELNLRSFLLFTLVA